MENENNDEYEIEREAGEKVYQQELAEAEHEHYQAHLDETCTCAEGTAKFAKKKWLVIWHYMANYGSQTVEAYTAEEAKNQVYGGRKELEFFVIPDGIAIHFEKEVE